MSIREVFKVDTVGRSHDVEYLSRIEFIADGMVRIEKAYDLQDIRELYSRDNSVDKHAKKDWLMLGIIG